jgi:hypothetical protein
MDIGLEPSKEIFDTTNEVNKYVLAATNSLGSLRDFGFTIMPVKE